MREKRNKDKNVFPLNYRAVSKDWSKWQLTDFYQILTLTWIPGRFDFFSFISKVSFPYKYAWVPHSHDQIMGNCFLPSLKLFRSSGLLIDAVARKTPEYVSYPGNNFFYRVQNLMSIPLWDQHPIRPQLLQKIMVVGTKEWQVMYYCRAGCPTIIISILDFYC